MYAVAADGSVEFAQFGEQFACSSERVHLLMEYLALVRVNALVRSDDCHIPDLARGRLGQSQFILAAVPVLRAGRVEFIPHGLNLHVSAGQSVGGDVAVLERDVRHDVFLSVVVVDTSIHTVAGIVKRAAPGLEPGRVPLRLWCSCGSAGQAPDHEFLTVVEVLGYWELDRGAMASAGDRLCAGHDRDEPTASTGALVLGNDSLEGEGGGGGGGVGHDVLLRLWLLIPAYTL